MKSHSIFFALFLFCTIHSMEEKFFTGSLKCPSNNAEFPLPFPCEVHPVIVEHASVTDQLKFRSLNRWARWIVDCDHFESFCRQRTIHDMRNSIYAPDKVPDHAHDYESFFKKQSPLYCKAYGKGPIFPFYIEKILSFPGFSIDKIKNELMHDYAINYCITVEPQFSTVLSDAERKKNLNLLRQHLSELDKPARIKLIILPTENLNQKSFVEKLLLDFLPVTALQIPYIENLDMELLLKNKFYKKIFITLRNVLNIVNTLAKNEKDKEKDKNKNAEGDDKKNKDKDKVALWCEEFVKSTCLEISDDTIDRTLLGYSLLYNGRIAKYLIKNYIASRLLKKVMNDFSLHNDPWEKMRSMHFIKYYLKYGINPNSFCGKTRLLTKSIQQKIPELTKILLKHGANPNLCELDNTDLLSWVLYHYHNYSLANLLIEHGANPNAEQSDKKSHLYNAIDCGTVETIGALLRHGGYLDPLEKNKLLLHHVLNSRRLEELLPIILKQAKGIDSIARDKNGNTVLHKAILLDSHTIFHQLLSYIKKDIEYHEIKIIKANTESETLNKQLQYIETEFKQLTEVEELLNAQNKYGETPFDIALSRNRINIKLIAILLEEAATLAERKKQLLKEKAKLLNDERFNVEAKKIKKIITLNYDKYRQRKSDFDQAICNDLKGEDLTDLIKKMLQNFDISIIFKERWLLKALEEDNNTFVKTFLDYAYSESPAHAMVLFYKLFSEEQCKNGLLIKDDIIDAFGKIVRCDDAELLCKKQFLSKEEATELFPYVLVSTIGEQHGDAIQKFINFGVDINHRYKNQKTFLQIALEAENHAQIKRLLQFHPQITMNDLQGVSRWAPHKEILKTLVEYCKSSLGYSNKCSYGRSLLYYAFKSEDAELCRKLIESGIDINKSSDFDGVNTPVSSAIANNDSEKLQFIVDLGGTINFSHISTALKNTASRQIIAILFKHYKFDEPNRDLTIRSSDDRGLLYYAFALKNKGVIKKLIKLGIDVMDVNHRNHFDGKDTALEFVIKDGDCELLEFVLSYLRDKDKENGTIIINFDHLNFALQETPRETRELIIATLLKHYKFVEQEQNTTIRSYDKKSLLYYACRLKHRKAIKKLIKLKMDINNPTDFDGRTTALKFIIKEGDCHLLDFVLSLKDGVVKFKHLNLALKKMQQETNDLIIKTLLKHYKITAPLKKTYRRHDQIRNLLQYAIKTNNNNFAAQLLSLGASVDFGDLLLAWNNNNLSLTATLLKKYFW